MTPASQTGEPWGIQFFQRVSAYGAPAECPTTNFLDSIPPEMAAEIESVLEAVSVAPPITFRGGGKWQIMHGDMSGIYEVRCSRGGKNYRLFCLLVKESPAFEGSAIVCLGGLVKPKNSAADNRAYEEILRFRTEFEKHQSVI
jgi:hypothetical protein